MNLFSRLIDTNDSASSKRFLGLVMSGFFIVAACCILISKNQHANQQLMHEILLYSILIIFVAILGMSVETAGNILLERSKVQAASDILSPHPAVGPINKVNNVTVSDNKVDDPGPPQKDVDTDGMPEIKQNLMNSLKPR